jgi:hypothetical protein
MKKLSTVLLKKTKGIPQGFYEMKSLGGSYCALGAISKAVGIEPNVHQYFPGKALRSLFPCLSQKVQFGSSKFKRSLTNTIARLNDSKGWSFKQIGNWLKKRGF